MTTERTTDQWTIIFGLFGFANFATGIWMLLAPVHWYENIPAGVPDFGPMNEHFVRDIGCIFTLIGAGLLAAAREPSLRVVACAFAAGFSILHALVHVLDTARGLVGPEHWWIDLPGIYVPAILLSWLLVAVRRSES